ncbi:MAG: hypothetical protein Q8P68_05195 [Candidatus Peregrinibacteria bacterium]|nr:hypothetical protein [Candidatus Peregrinibacteria bacterium]
MNTFGGEKISCGTIQSGGVIEDDKTSEGEVEAMAVDCGMRVENVVKNGSAHKKIQLNLSENTLNQLLELQEKGLKIDELFNEFLQKRNQEIAEEKEEIAQEIAKKEISRYVPRKVKGILKKEFGTKCAVRNCGKNAEQIHHTARFELTHSHNPYFMAPFCKAHHDIAHSMDERFLLMKGGKLPGGGTSEGGEATRWWDE